MAEDHVLTESELNEALARLPGWEVRDDWLRRTFTTPGWPHTVMLVATIGYLAEAAWHHPDLSVGYAKVTVKLQTHRVRAVNREHLRVGNLLLDAGSDDQVFSRQIHRVGWKLVIFPVAALDAYSLFSVLLPMLRRSPNQHSAVTIHGDDWRFMRPNTMIHRRLFLQFAMVLVAFQASRPLQGAPTVGVYYYPWYGSFSAGHSLNQSLRGHLNPPQPPAIGLYSNRDSETISAHIDQSHKGNVDFWAVSWWGPQSAEDFTFRTSILMHPRRTQLQYAVHYETSGRLGDAANPIFNNLIPDFRYLANNYFQNPSYLKIDGRPVVFMYVTRAYFNTQASRDAVASLRSTMVSEFGVDPYIVGDDLFSDGTNLQRAQLWDAITDFDVYGSVLQSKGSTAAALTQLAALYDYARNLLANTNVGFIPTASPGFNDTGVRTGHPAAPRYFVNDPTSNEGDLFSRMLNQVVVSRTDPKADNILMINSFNEWHEDTQIEPSVVAPRTNTDDSGNQQYTEGHFYEGYGDLYLNILRSASVIAGDYNNNGFVDAADYVVWRQSAGQTGPGLIADGNHNHQIDTGDYNVWRARFGQTAGSGSALNVAVPEQASAVLCLITMLMIFSRRTWQPRKLILP